jgi:hypothetical protein
MATSMKNSMTASLERRNSTAPLHTAHEDTKYNTLQHIAHAPKMPNAK